MCICIRLCGRNHTGQSWQLQRCHAAQNMPLLRRMAPLLSISSTPLCCGVLLMLTLVLHQCYVGGSRAFSGHWLGFLCCEADDSPQTVLLAVGCTQPSSHMRHIAVLNLLCSTCCLYAEAAVLCSLPMPTVVIVVTQGVYTLSLCFAVAVLYRVVWCRGRYMVGLAAHWMVGSIFSAGMGWAIIPTAPDAWRVFLAVASAPAWCAAVGAWFMPESSRLLLVQGHTDKPEQVLPF